MQAIDVPALERLVRSTVIWIWTYVALAVPAGAGFLAVELLGGSFAEPLSAFETSVMAVALLTGTAFIVAGVFVLRWVHRTNRIGHALGGDAVSISPAWNVWWFFVPVASLWMPFRGLRQSYQASIDPLAPGAVRLPRSMRLWWGSWLASNLAFHLGWRLHNLNEDLGVADTIANLCYAFACTLAVPLCLALVATIRTISAAQADAARAAVFA